MKTLTLADAAALCAIQGLDAKRRGQTKKEKTLLEAALILARRSRRGRHLVEFLVGAIKDVGNPYQHKRGALSDKPGKSAGMVAGGARSMVGCGTHEMMKRSQIKDVLSKYDGVNGVDFNQADVVHVRVDTEEHGQALPKDVYGRTVTYTVGGQITKRQVK